MPAASIWYLNSSRIGGIDWLKIGIGESLNEEEVTCLAVGSDEESNEEGEEFESIIGIWVITLREVDREVYEAKKKKDQQMM